MAFTVVLVTNLFIVWGSVRAGSKAVAASGAADLDAPAVVSNPQMGEMASIPAPSPSATPEASASMTKATGAASGAES